MVLIVDKDIEKYCEKTILAISDSVLVEADFPEEAVKADDAEKKDEAPKKE